MSKRKNKGKRMRDTSATYALSMEPVAFAGLVSNYNLDPSIVPSEYETIPIDIRTFYQAILQRSVLDLFTYPVGHKYYESAYNFFFVEPRYLHSAEYLYVTFASICEMFSFCPKGFRKALKLKMLTGDNTGLSRFRTRVD